METKYGGGDQLAAISAVFVTNSTHGCYTDIPYLDTCRELQIQATSQDPAWNIAVDSMSSGDVPCRSAIDWSSDIADEWM